MLKKIIPISIFLAFIISGLSIPELAYGCGGPGDPEGVCWIELNPDTWVPTCDCGGGGANPYAPDINGTVRDSWGNRLAGVEIRWTDSNGHLRKRWTDANGYYSYASWVLDCNGYPWPDNPYFTAMHNNEYGSFPNAPWWSNTNEFSAYSQIQNPHTIAPQKPGNWYGAFIPNSRATNFDLLVEPVCSPAWVRDFTYKNPPTARVDGPVSGYVGQAYNFTSTANGPGMGLVQIYWADATSDLTQAGSWHLINQTGDASNAGCDGSTQCTLYTASFTPPAAGQYIVAVNAAANFAAPATWCYGNPLLDSGQLTGSADCNAGYSFQDSIVFTASSPSGSISTSPNPCLIPYGQGSQLVNLTYTFQGSPDNGAILCWGATPASAGGSGAVYSYSFPAGSYPFSLHVPSQVGGVWNCSGGQIATATVSCSNAVGPTVTSLQVNNAIAGQTTYSGTARKSGLLSTDNGSNWLNPLGIQLNATAGSGSIKLYAVAFYDKVLGLATGTNMEGIRTKIGTDSKNGFILAYAASACANSAGNCQVDSSGQAFTAGHYYVYGRRSNNTTGWTDITGTSGSIYDSVSGNIVLTAAPVSAAPKWQVSFKGAFGNKDMYTADFAIDTYNVPTFEPDRVTVP